MFFSICFFLHSSALPFSFLLTQKPGKKQFQRNLWGPSSSHSSRIFGVFVFIVFLLFFCDYFCYYFFFGMVCFLFFGLPCPCLRHEYQNELASAARCFPFPAALICNYFMAFQTYVGYGMYLNILMLTLPDKPLSVQKEIFFGQVVDLP